MKKIKLPPNTYIWKRKYNGLQMGGHAVFVSEAQIFLECCGNEKGCHDTIAIIPKGLALNEIINSISDEEAGKVFHQYGWLVKGYNNTKYTRCPICATKLKVTKKIITK